MNLILLLFLILIVAVIVKLFTYYHSRVSYFKTIDKFPGPTVKELLHYISGTTTPYETYNYFSNLNKKYGPVVKLWIRPFTPMLQVSDLEVFQQILISKNHLVRSDIYSLFAPYLPDGLATSSSEVWKKDRKALSPAFSQKQVESFLPIFEKHTTTFLKMMNEKTDKAVDLQPLMNLLFLDVIFESLTMHNLNVQTNENLDYHVAKENFSKIIGQRVYSPLLQIDFIFKYTPFYKQMMDLIKTLKGFTSTVFEERSQKNLNEGCFLDILLETDMSKNKMKCNLDTVILAGHDTTSSAMSYVLFELARRPEIQQKVLAEINSILENSDGSGVSIASIHDMKFLDCVVKETIRYHSVVPIIQRKTGADITIDGVHIPKGTCISLNILGLHKSERYFRKAEDFVPERFLPENIDEMNRQAFAAFSLGPRDCMGKYFALLVAKYAVARIVRNFELIAVKPEHELKIMAVLTTKSLNGIPIIFKSRRE